LVSGGGAMETVAGNVAISGRILGNQALVKSGSAALILSGSNSFTGGAVVLEGTLDLLGPSALPDGSALTIGNAAGVFAPVVTAPGIPSAGPAAVPEPGSLALLGSLAVTVVAWSCRRRSRSAP
jgi:autotransporter-associated beta strand protein